MVNIIDLSPKPATEAYRLETANGTVELELNGIDIVTLSELCRRYPAFTRIVEGAAGGSIFAAAEAMPAVIAAGLGQAGSTEYEDKIRQFSARDNIAMTLAVLRLTFPPAVEPERPLPAAGDVITDMAPFQPASSN
jgi:hypothetical protein